jgi:PPOX class probable F420-dependent enzyme
MSNIPEQYIDLFTTKKAFAHLATINPDGTPQVTPVWFDYDGTHVIVNTARGRLKDKNMQRDPRVTVTVSDPDDPYRYIQLRGRVVETTEQGGYEKIVELSKKYRGPNATFPRRPNEVRVTVKILPERVHATHV